MKHCEVITPDATPRANLAASIRQSLNRLPAGHYGHYRARQSLKLLESDCPITPRKMTAIRQNADWYVDYLELRAARWPAHWTDAEKADAERRVK